MTGENLHTIEVKNLSLGYRHRILHRDINFTSHAGEVISVLGINGSGKSTLIRTLAGLHKKTAGEILIGGNSSDTISRYQFARTISIVFSAPKAHMPDMTVYEMMKMGRFPYTGMLDALTENDHHVITKNAQLLRIESLLHTSIYELSDGEFQKVLIGRALVQNTPVILLDEPTSHLDSINKVIIFQLLKDLAVENRNTIIFATHEIESALSISDKCLLLDKNMHSVFASPEELLQNQMINRFFDSGFVTFDNSSRRFVTTQN